MADDLLDEGEVFPEYFPRATGVQWRGFYRSWEHPRFQASLAEELGTSRGAFKAARRCHSSPLLGDETSASLQHGGWSLLPWMQLMKWVGNSERLSGSSTLTPGETLDGRSWIILRRP